MKKSFIVKFPIHQEFNHGLSWAQINELSWQEFNLLSWKDLNYLARRYLEYSIKYIKKMSETIQFTLKKVR
jgi:hypothetical protein